MHTFLFADLVGFTALSIEEGDEQAANVATRFQREVRYLAARHGARVVKSLGDGAMVRAQDAGDAVRLGLELANGLDGLPPVRVGLNTGPRWSATATTSARRSTSRHACHRRRAAARCC